MTPEDQNRLEAKAAALDSERAAALSHQPVENGTPGADAQPEPEPPQQTNAQVVSFIFNAIREASCHIFAVESPRKTLSAEVCQTLGDSLGPIADKHGLNLAASFGSWAQEFGAAVVCGPLLWGAYRALDDELRAKRAPKQSEGMAGPSGQPQQPVQMATVVDG